MTGERRPRRGLALGVAAVVVLAGATYGALRPPKARPAPLTSPTPSPSPSPSPPAWPPSPDPAPVNDAAGDWAPPAMTGETGLVVAGPSARGVRVLDLDTGRTSAPIGPAGGMVDAVAAIDGGWLLVRRPQCVDDAACAPSEVLTVRGGRTRGLGVAHTVRPDPDRRTVWLTRFAGNAPAEGGWLERRTYDGVLVGPRTRLRPYEDVAVVGPDGPVLVGEQAVVTLLRGESRQRVPVVGQGRVLGMVGRLVLWADLACDVGGRRPCTVSTTEPGTGVTAEVVAPDGPIALVAVDPSGEHVAMGSYGDAGELSVVSYVVSTGRPQAVAAGVPNLDTITWSPDGRWLLLVREAWDGTRFDGQRIAVWSPGDDTAHAAGTYPTEGPLAVGPAR
jgi:hypothetical protein